MASLSAVTATPACSMYDSLDPLFVPPAQRAMPLTNVWYFSVTLVRALTISSARPRRAAWARLGHGPLGRPHDDREERLHRDDVRDRIVHGPLGFVGVGHRVQEPIGPHRCVREKEPSRFAHHGIVGGEERGVARHQVM